MSEIATICFDFKDYKKAFQKYKEYAEYYGAASIHLVVSEHPYSSGYWIESSDILVTKDTDHRYYGNLEVGQLEERVNKFMVDKKVGKHTTGVAL